jgi:hypothetical protein
VREHADAAADAAAAAAAATPHGCVDYHSWADPLRLALQRRALRRYQGTYVLLTYCTRSYTTLHYLLTYLLTYPLTYLLTYLLTLLPLLTYLLTYF